VPRAAERTWFHTRPAAVKKPDQEEIARLTESIAGRARFLAPSARPQCRAACGRATRRPGQSRRPL